MKLPISAVFASLLACSAPAEDIELAGYVQTPGGLLFSLRGASTDTDSGWIKLDETWNAHHLVSFDANTEELTLRHRDEVRTIRPRTAFIGKSLILAKLVAGSFTPVDGSVVYGPDAVVKLRDMLITSPTGVMVSNENQTQIHGDLVIADAHFTGAKIEEKNGEITIIAESMSFPPDWEAKLRKQIGPEIKNPAAH